MNRLKSPVGLAILIVLLLSIGGAAAAGTGLITGKEIKDHSITGREIKRKSIPLSALRTVPAGQGKEGAKGDQGDPGLTGDPGEPGASAFTEAFSFEGAIAATVAPSSEWKFLGSEEAVFFAGDRGQITVSATIAAGSGGIDDSADFNLGLCFDQGEGPEPFSETDVGTSPTLPEDQRVTVPLVTAFGVTGEPGEGFQAEVGPCVLNETAVDLTGNGRFQGSILIAAA